uniref:RING-Gid-type domain-containing protein n=1 Tax=Romanomermis culicivorax TaxID=13658 RepID=A0A915KIE4_ROMCU
MGALLYISKGLEHSPYKDLRDSALWNQLCALFVNDACAMMGLSTKSPLSIILNTGAKALPALLNIKQIMQQRQVMGMWSHNDELPASISIELDSENRYHSVFSCPILRQQTTDKNPPMRLQCGHVISREALQKLASNNKLKCPYCPQESVVADAKQLYF